MKPRMLQARKGIPYKIRIDPLTLFQMANIAEVIENVLSIRPSQAVVIRMALRYYGQFVSENINTKQSIKALKDEKQQLLIAAGKVKSEQGEKEE